MWSDRIRGNIYHFFRRRIHGKCASKFHLLIARFRSDARARYKHNTDANCATNTLRATGIARFDRAEPRNKNTTRKTNRNREERRNPRYERLLSSSRLPPYVAAEPVESHSCNDSRLKFPSILRDCDRPPPLPLTHSSLTPGPFIQSYTEWGTKFEKSKIGRFWILIRYFAVGRLVKF